MRCDSVLGAKDMVARCDWCPEAEVNNATICGGRREVVGEIGQRSVRRDM